MNFVTKLPWSWGYNCLIIITDRLTNFVKIEPMNTTATAPEVTDHFYCTWYHQFGLPSAIISDCDKLFVSHFWKVLFKKVNVHFQMFTAYHFKTDEFSERLNKMVIEVLHHYVNTQQSDWADHLIQVESAMNNSVNVTTEMIPTELIYSSSLHLFPHPTDTSSEFPTITDFIEWINESIVIVQDQHMIVKTW